MTIWRYMRINFNQPVWWTITVIIYISCWLGVFGILPRCYDLVTSTPISEHRYIQLHSKTRSQVPHWCNPALTCSQSSDLTLLPIISSLSYFLYEHCFTLPYLLYPVLSLVMPVYFHLTHIRFLRPPSDPSGLSLYVHNTFWTWIVLCSLFVQTLSYISRTTPVYFLCSLFVQTSSYISRTTPVYFFSLNLDLSST